MRSHLSASALATDLYELTMMAGYVAAGRHYGTEATFELFVRRLPHDRRYLVAAGLEQALDYLEHLRVAEDELAWLSTVPALARSGAAFFDYLKNVRFTGEVWAVAEGTPVFPNEPLLRVTAPLPEAQLVETALLAIVNFQTTIASKATRIVRAAAGRSVMEFGSRRAHGLEAALYAARAAYLAGCDATSFVEAGRRFGIPLTGTMAHSWILASKDELTGMREYLRLFGDTTTLLIDTYDTLEAARQIARAGLQPAAVRLDSGDLVSLSREVRKILDAAGLNATKIVVSGDLDERKMQALLAAGAPVDGFGVGTSLTTSDDAPALGGVYKLVEMVERETTHMVMKRSPGKSTWPGKKQVWRRTRAGDAIEDVVALETEAPVAGARPLLTRVMARGTRLEPARRLSELRDACRRRVAELPPGLRELDGRGGYRITVSDVLKGVIERS